MKLKKWLAIYIVGLLIGLILIICFNIFTDSFGVFGDRILNWYGYDMTMNPRVGKIGYLEKMKPKTKYDSFILGSSKSSSINPETLNKYYKGANFYNMMAYGADLKHMEQTFYYLINNYKVKNIVLHIGISELITYDNKTKDLKEELHAKVSKTNTNDFYLRHLFLNPKYGLEKINAFINDYKKQKPTLNDVFLPELGVYNKTKRDLENIVNISEYVNNIDGFLTNYANHNSEIGDSCIISINNMKKVSQEKGINFLVVSSPNYDLELLTFKLDKVKEYWEKLSLVTEFWNFSGYTSISSDPRFFYDSVHYRNILGDMMIAKIFGDDSFYFPKDFGYLMTKDNSKFLSEELLTFKKDITGYIDLNAKNEKIKLPILMYHHIVADGAELNLATITKEKFYKDMLTFKNAGFNTILYSDVIDYANGNIDKLPEKSLLITFDDGYLSNYEYAFPILKQFNMKANINIIGWSIGRDKRIGSEDNITPHFNLNQLIEMKESGLIEFGSHSFDLHEDVTNYPYRDGALKKENETLSEYYEVLKNDKDDFQNIIKESFYPDFFCYPYGKANFITDYYIKELGYKGSFLIGNKISEIIKGKPYSLFGLNRINASYDIKSEDLLIMITE